MKRILLSLLFLLSLTQFAGAQVAHFPEDCAGVNMNWVNVPQPITVNGVPFQVVTTVNQVGKQVCLTTSLQDLDSKIGALVATAPLPNNNCASYFQPNYVATVANTALHTGSGPNITAMQFTMDGKITPWDCHPGIPIVTTTWTTKVIQITKKIKIIIQVPHTVSNPGPDIKTPGITANYGELGLYTMQPSANGLGVAINTTSSFTGAAQLTQGIRGAVDRTSFVYNLLVLSVPIFPTTSIPLRHVTGARYYGGESQIWGTVY